MSQPGLPELREEIDRLDDEILVRLQQRGWLAVQVGRVKAEAGRPVHDPDRERQLLAGLACRAQGPLGRAALEAVFSEIVSACRALQEPLKVAFLGPEGTYSHSAAQARFGRLTALEPAPSIGQVFAEVEAGRVEFGVVPVENSLEGGVGQTLDELTLRRVTVCGEIYLEIRHCLLSLAADLKAVGRVYSHPQALGQCRGWLAAHLPGREAAETASTAAAARQAAQEAGAAAVGSALLAERFGLNLLARDIQDGQTNLTRFFVLGRNPVAASGRDKTSLLFTTAHRPGALSRCLAPLAEAGLNLTRIESRPAKDRPFEYFFFVDVEGHPAEPAVAQALARLAEATESFRVLGAYPAEPPGREGR